MFEDSTFASINRIRTRSRAGFFAAITFDTAIALALVLAPLIYPRVLPHVFGTILMNAPAAPTDEPKPQPRTIAHPATAVLHYDPYQPPTKIPTLIDYSKGPEPTAITSVVDLVGTDAATGGNNPFSGQPAINVARGPDQRPVRVSSSVVEGLLLQKTLPAYPPIARASRMQGTVVLQATISRSGAIENLRVVSGLPMLQRAALDAVSTWRYRPYLLNGQPIEVETTINVVFKLDE